VISGSRGRVEINPRELCNDTEDDGGAGSWKTIAAFRDVGEGKLS
jgi:hypothetical protein